MKFCTRFLILLAVVAACNADEVIPVLTVKDEVYKNVTVTEVTATDIYFTSKSGMGNAKLKNLSPELQKHFQYDPSKSAQVEQAQKQANANFRKVLAEAKPAARPSTTITEATFGSDSDDFVVPELSARSIRGQIAPVLTAEKWLTPKPITFNKFVLIDFWATWCRYCREAVPNLNKYQQKYKDQLIVIGLSDETEADVRAMTEPKMEYAVAIDTAAKMKRNLQVTGIPHCILIDPRGIVRFEGNPNYLDDQKLEHILTKYSL